MICMSIRSYALFLFTLGCVFGLFLFCTCKHLYMQISKFVFCVACTADSSSLVNDRTGASRTAIGWGKRWDTLSHLKITIFHKRILSKQTFKADQLLLRNRSPPCKLRSPLKIQESTGFSPFDFDKFDLCCVFYRFCVPYLKHQYAHYWLA
jgi:hypothetical protein